MENIFTNLLINLKHLQNTELEEKKSTSPDKEKNQIWQSEKISFQSAVKKKKIMICLSKHFNSILIFFLLFSLFGKIYYFYLKLTINRLDSWRCHLKKKKKIK